MRCEKNGKMLSFHVKFLLTDGRTTVKQYAPHLSMQGHENKGPKHTHFAMFWNFYVRRRHDVNIRTVQSTMS